jgi:hypothetical protein
MIIRIEKSGGSFRGAGQYYLHDKAAEKGTAKELMPSTDERVWFTDTRNCANLDPEKALDEMWHVAESQQWLKAQVGGRTSGRRCTEPVKTLTIAWAKEDAPTPEHMMEAADAFLKHMGWDGHQAVYVAHRDTEHRHLHIILNRVDHETGRTLDDGFEHRRAQAFALSYEKEMGRLWCVEREINAAEREKRPPELDKSVTERSPDRQPANQHIPDNVIEILRPAEKALAKEEQARLNQFAAERGSLKAEQRAEREAWFKDGARLFKETRHAVYDAVREEFREQWRELYRDRAAATREAEAHSGTAMERAFHFAERGDWEKALGAFGDRNAVRDDAAKEMAERLAVLKAEQTAAIRERQDEAIRELRESRDAQYKELLDRQREERSAMRAAHVQGQSAEFVLETRRGGDRDAGDDAKVIANDNRVPVAEPQRQPEARDVGTAEPTPAPVQIQDTSPEVVREVLQPEAAQAREAEREADRGTFSMSTPEAPEPTKQAPDLVTGPAGAVFGYVADQMAELFAPTPPEVREAREKAEARRESERPVRDETDPWSRLVEAAIRAAEREREEKRSQDYWQDREARDREWERDR